jgi:hypothetical protein
MPYSQSTGLDQQRDLSRLATLLVNLGLHDFLFGVATHLQAKLRKLDPARAYPVASARLIKDIR